MINAIFDTNVILDLLLERKPFAASAVHAVANVEKRRIEGLVCATTLTTVHYLLSNTISARQSIAAIGQILKVFKVAAVNREVIEMALSLGFKDFEDAVLHEAGRLAGADSVITRNGRDFVRGSLAIYTPAELVAIMSV